jgi:hypothetical protein
MGYDKAPELPDMQQLWTDLELHDNEFLRQDPTLKKEVWKLIFQYRDIFLSTTPGCTDVAAMPQAGHPAPLPEV